MYSHKSYFYHRDAKRLSSGARHLSKFWAQAIPIGGEDDLSLADILDPKAP
jgi:hypothetical protein